MLNSYLNSSLYFFVICGGLEDILDLPALLWLLAFLILCFFSAVFRISSMTSNSFLWIHFHGLFILLSEIVDTFFPISKKNTLVKHNESFNYFNNSSTILLFSIIRGWAVFLFCGFGFGLFSL